MSKKFAFMQKFTKLLYLSPLLYSMFMIQSISCVKDDAVDRQMVTVDISSQSEAEIRYSEIYDTVHTIPLNNIPQLIGNIGNIVVSDEYILLADKRLETVYVLTTTGEFLFSVGSEGDGPGELINLDDVRLSASGDEILLLDRTAHRIYGYNMNDGMYQRAIPLIRYASAIAPLSPNFVALYHNSEVGGVDQNSRVSVRKLNQNVTTAGFLPIKEKYRSFLNFNDRANFYRYNDKLFFYYGFNDTIYHIEPEVCTPYLVVDFEKAIPQDFMDRGYNDAYDFMVQVKQQNFMYRLISFMETVSFYQFMYMKGENIPHHCYFNKEQGEQLSSDVVVDDMLLGAIAFTDFEDVFGIFPLTHQGGKNYFIYHPLQIQQAVDEGFEVHPDLRDLDDEDNPVLVVGVLRS